MARLKQTEVNLVGLDRFIRKFNIGAAQLTRAMGAAIYQEANVIADEADLLVPYDTGTLARSQIVHPPAVQGTSVFVEITYGSPADGYAEVQHEREDFSHPSLASGLPPNGRQAKYLEEPLDDAVKEDRLSQLMAWRIENLLLKEIF